MPAAERIVQVRPTPTAFLEMCTIVPTDTVQIPVVPESFQIEEAGYAPDGTNLPGFDGLDSTADIAAWSVNYLEAVRVGRMVYPVPLTLLQDAGQAQAVVDRLITQNWSRTVENYIVAGSSPNLVGIMNTPGIVTSSAEGTPVDALASAVAAVASGGFYGPHAVVGAPRTLERVWTAQDSTGNYLRLHTALPTVGAWVFAPGLPDGLVIVGDPLEVVVYLQGTFGVLVSQNVGDAFARGVSALKGEQRAAVWVRNPDAFNVVTGL